MSIHYLKQTKTKDWMTIKLVCPFENFALVTFFYNIFLVGDESYQRISEICLLITFVRRKRTNDVFFSKEVTIW